ncbi:transglycosylase SLT domain-containing protein [Actinacidiphila paucisporea]|uniref:Transglycosylase SLT domain-containing protein n=1 Tax=Actinacidiphila paucisporea TaxID=310782 RepID=A0A1M6X900_9ACTN|nr:transglycosylase SLT domain-containing protein [Actinacidiphila paucisporea]SHL02398.1 Transglycosylase SLT domain-containing protein [Actinacidiphila paucisporea]
MQLPTIPKKLPTFAKFNQMSKKHKITSVGAAAATAVVLTVTGLAATAGAGSATAAGDPTGFSVSTGTHAKELGAQTGMASQHAIHDAAPKTTQKKTDLAAAAKPSTEKKVVAAKPVTEKKIAAAKPATEKKAADAAAAKKAAAAAADRAKSKAAANRSTHRAPVSVPKKTHTVATPKKAAAAPKKATVKKYANNLDGWIRQSLDIMHKKGIPGTYEGIHRNIIRESSGNPKAINLWDINARNGIPSKGLLQVINPTFDRYHVSGTSHNIYDPVANITAACNYAADRYGTMDNVNSAY